MKVQEIITAIDGLQNKYIGLWELGHILPQLDGTFVCDIDETVLNALCSPIMAKTTIYRCEDGFVGISGCSELLTSSQTVKDITCELRAARYYERTEVTYSLNP